MAMAASIGVDYSVTPQGITWQHLLSAVIFGVMLTILVPVMTLAIIGLQTLNPVLKENGVQWRRPTFHDNPIQIRNPLLPFHFLGQLFITTGVLLSVTSIWHGVLALGHGLLTLWFGVMLLVGLAWCCRVYRRRIVEG